jgi:hypothetical protein
MRRFGISMRVAREFYHNAKCKARLPITTEQAWKVVIGLSAGPPVGMDADNFKVESNGFVS